MLHGGSMRSNILILLTLLITTACIEPGTVKSRVPASTFGTELSENEAELAEDLNSILNKYSRSKEVSIEARNSEQALEFNISYNTQDRGSFEVYSGIRMRNLKVLFNELYLELQQQEDPKLDLKKRKKLLINFYRED